MAEKKHKPMTDEEILVALRANVDDSVGLHSSELSRERTTVMEYYDGSKPAPSHKGNSKYVSLDVYDSVESMKAALLETFAAGHNIISFAPNGAEDVEMARIATEYCDQVLFTKNPGYSVFQSVIHDGLMARIGVAKYWYEKKVEDIEETFADLSVEELDFLLAQPEVGLKELQVHPDTGHYSGTIVRIEDRSQIRIAAIPPEEFIVEPKAKCLEDAFVAHRMRKTKSDLLKEGYDRKLVEKITDDDEGWHTDPEVLARFENIGASMREIEEYQEQVRKVWVYECYIDLDIEGTGQTKLWKITMAGNVILDKEQVRRKPFVVFVPLPRPHSLIGSNYADKVIPTQNAKTVLTRGILDHTVITNNPRYQVVKGSLMNPHELMDNRLGGLVNVTRPDGIAPLPQASLNPFVFQTIQLLDYDLEDTTGVSKLSQGLNKDALSKQNSFALVEQLTSLSQQRQKIIARNFAEQFLRPLFLAIYEVALENVERDEILDVAGNWVEVTPMQWRRRTDVTVELHLGYGEQEAEAQKFLGLHAVLTQDPTVAPLYTLDKKYNILKRVFEKKGCKNVSDYLNHPSEVPPPQPDPVVMLQIKQAELQMELQVAQQRMAEAKLQLEIEEKRHKMELEKLKLQSQHALQSDKLDLEERAQIHKEHVDNAELEIAEKATDVRAIASPTG